MDKKIILREKLKKLDNEAEIIREELDDIQKKENIPKLKNLIGKCFVYYRNCYPCPKKKSDYWNTYRKVLDFVSNDDGCWFICEEFDIDNSGKIELKIDYIFADYLKIGFTGYDKISKKEYDEKKEMLLKEMETQNKLRKHLE